MRKEVIIIGAGGHSKVIADIIRKSGDTVYGFLDDIIIGKDVIGKVSDCLNHLDKQFVIAIGDNKKRMEIAEKYKDLKYYVAIHPSAILSEKVELGCGTVIMANVVVNASTNVGKHCILNTASVIEHDNEIGDYSHISPNATLCGTVKVGKLTHIGAGAIIKNNINVCDRVTVGVGGVVVKDIVTSGVYIGVPVIGMSK